MIQKRARGWTARLVVIFLTAHATAAWTDNSTGKHFVWQVQNVATPIYLVGSLHSLRASDYPLPEIIERVIGSSQQVLFESDPDAKDAPLMFHKLNEAGNYPDHVTIGDKVRPETFARLKQIATVRLSEYERRKPWAIAYFNLINQNTSEFKTRLGMDRYLYYRARGHAKVGGLETTDQFVRAFKALSDAESESYLLEAIGYAHRSPQLLIDTGEAWKQGDTGRLYRLYAPRRRPSGYWNWLERRQVTWLPQIEQAIRSGQPTAIVVGALHLCGPRSLIAMLRARGYKIEQL